MKKFFYVFVFAVANSLHAQSIFTTNNGAIDGYDPVGYYTANEPVKGKESISYEWNGATWYFASESNKNLFQQDPKKYAPQYGGYCAYAVAKGSKAKIDPATWAIVNDKLYLNYDQSIKKRWEKDRENFIRRADENWPKVKDD